MSETTTTTTGTAPAPRVRPAAPAATKWRIAAVALVIAGAIGWHLIMAIGGLLAATDRRYRARVKATVVAAARPPAIGRSPEPATAT